MSKSEKRAFFSHVFANNFFLVHFSKLLQRIRNQREILRFLTPLSIFHKKKFFRSYQYFFRTLTANAQETAQKNGKSFFMNVSQNLIMHPSKGLHNQVVKIVVPQCTPYPVRYVESSFEKGWRIFKLNHFCIVPVVFLYRESRTASIQESVSVVAELGQQM